VLISLFALACLPAVAKAARPTSLHVTFTPERLGQSTTVEFDVHIRMPAGHAPSPLTALDLQYPSTLGFAASDLGLETCSQPTLEVQGPAGCPADSRMGGGSALAEIPIGPVTIREAADVTVVRAPEASGHVSLLFYVAGTAPVVAQLAFPSLLLPGSTPSEERVHIDVPVVPGSPGAPDISILRLRTAFGPRGLIYYERVRGRLVAYKPRGILLPDRCPHGGFPFSAAFGFLNGSHAYSRDVVPCPYGRTPRRR
jgi:hypothetical protein